MCSKDELRTARMNAHLLLRLHQSRRDPGRVNSAAGVLVDFDVGLPAAAFWISGTVKQIQDLFVVQLPQNTHAQTQIIKQFAHNQ